MPDEKQNISEQDYKAQLVEQKVTALANANELIGQKLDAMTRLAKGEHVIQPMNVFTKANVIQYNDPILRAYQEKANESTREFERLANQEERAYLLARQNIIFSTWQRRLGVILDLNGKDNRDPNLREIQTQGADLIRNLSVPQFMAETLRGPLQKAYIDQIEARGQEVAPDLTTTLVRLKEGRIAEEDWKIILINLRSSEGSGKDWIEAGSAQAIIGALPPHLRAELLTRLQKEPNYEQIVLHLLTFNYFTSAQVEAVLNAQIKVAKEVNQKTDVLEAILLKAQDPTLTKRQEQIEKAQVEGVKRIHKHRMVGHSNSMRELLTFKGLAGSLLAINGAATVAANLVMDMSMESWSDMPTNPAFLMGVGMLGGGLEMSNGFGGLMDRPSTQLGKILESKDQKKEQEEFPRQNAFERSVQRYPRAQEIYFQFAEEINAAYEKKMLKGRKVGVVLTMEEMGIHWQALPPEFKSMPKEETEKILSTWVERMAGIGIVKQSIQTQKLFIGGGPSNKEGKKSDCRVKYGLKPIEEWPENIKKNYVLNETIQ